MTPEQQRLADEKVEVVVLPNNRYGEAKAGERLYVTRAELASHGRCLALVQAAQAPRPRTAVIALPAEIARRHGLPLGRRQEGPIAYEVTRLPPDGKPRLPSRQELEAQAQGGAGPVATVKIDASAMQAVVEKLRGEVEQERQRLQEEARAYVRERLEAAEMEHRAELERMTARHATERGDINDLLGAAREEIGKLQSEVAKLRGAQVPERPAPAQAPSAPPLPKGKREP